MTTDCAFSGTDELMSSGSPAITTRSQDGAARTSQSSWGKVKGKSETRRMRTGPLGWKGWRRLASRRVTPDGQPDDRWQPDRAAGGAAGTAHITARADN